MTDLSKSVAAFRVLYNRGIEEIRKAAVCYVKTLKAHPDRIDEFRNQFVEITNNVWRLLERIGEGRAIPQLVQCAENPGYMQLAFCESSYQKWYVKKSNLMEILILDENNKSSVEEIHVSELTREQTRQVFHNGEIRNRRQQKAYLLRLRQERYDRALLKRQEAIMETRFFFEETYCVVDGCVQFLNLERGYSREELMKIISELDETTKPKRKSAKKKKS